MKLLAKSAGGTLDPQVNYTLQYWQPLPWRHTTACSPSRRPAATRPSPSCRTSPRRCRLRRTAARPGSFKIRKGIKFSNGKEVTTGGRRRLLPADLQGQEPDIGRLLRRHRRRGRLPEEAGDVHAQGRRQREHRRRGTVTINLTAPDPEFKYKLAVPHASIVPGGQPAEGCRDEAHSRHRARTTSRRTTRTSSWS